VDFYPTLWRGCSAAKIMKIWQRCWKVLEAEDKSN